MLNSLKRFFVFTLSGTLGLALWAMIFGAVTGVGAYVLAVTLSPNSHNSFGSMVWIALTAMFSIASPLGFLLFSGAFLLTPQPKNGVAQLTKLGAIRSLMGAVFLAIIGVSISAQLGSILPVSADDIMPAATYYLIFGWFLGFFAGIIWGVVEGVISLRKPKRNLKQPIAAPPIAAP